MFTSEATRIAKLWDLSQSTNVLANSTEMIMLKSNENDAPKNDSVKVGSEESNRPYQARVHKDLLCLFSTYYRTTLQEVDLGIFDNSLSLNLDSMACHMLTDMLALRRTVMTEVVRDTPPVPPLEQAAIVLNLLPSTAPLYGWLLDQFTHHVVLQYDTPTSLLPNEFLVDWVKRALHEGLQEWESTCYVAGVPEINRPNAQEFGKRPSRNQTHFGGLRARTSSMIRHLIWF
ncbi:unnamed protein product [Aureobasidium mustum]|uniref:Uncharacterized protein n=1 Tax=Aureobasidium mustum TaxID=2773714 RepID=A0A9N8JVT3_9PEZI|nr:unnamed protein product [Aureobasidium mustum]